MEEPELSSWGLLEGIFIIFRSVTGMILPQRWWPLRPPRFRGLRTGSFRPYCDLNRMRIEGFAVMEDLDHYACTVEEREEYEHLVRKGTVVYAGVDYRAIMEEAQKEAQILLWDGGNNDFSFIRPDL